MNKRAAHTILPWVITLASLVVTVVVFVRSRSSADDRARERLEAAAEAIQQSVRAELERYADALRAVEGLVAGSVSVTPQEFDRFVDALHLAERYYGTEGALRVRRTSRDGLIVIENVAPSDGIGFGIGQALTDGADELRAALDLAANSRLTVMAEPFPSDHDGDAPGTTQLLFVRHVPGSDEWLLLWVDAQMFITNAIGSIPSDEAVVVADVTRDDGRGETAGIGGTTVGTISSTSSEPGHTAENELSLLGRRWQFRLTHSGELVASGDRNQQWILLSGGLALTVALAVAFATQAHARRRADALADQASSSERIRRQLVESAPVAVVEVDEAGVVRGWNAAATDLLGQSAIDAIGTPLRIPVVSGVDRIDDRTPIADLHGLRLTLDTRAGERVVTAFASTTDPHHRTLILVDETGRLALEEQLEQAQKLELFGRLAGGIAHDFNNFLTPIVGYIDIVLMHDRLTEADRSALQEARRAADRAAALVAKLLTVSRHQVTKPTLIDVGRTIEELTALLSAAATGDVVLVTDLAAGDRPALVTMDRTQLEQVLLNLVVNAREAMSGHGRITISLRADATSVTIRVVDDGEGMDAATKASIFEPFFSTKHAKGGTGLGLATVYSIIAGAGGTVTVESELGRGTSFDLTLPRAEGAMPPSAEPATAVRGALRSASILLVEDDPSVRRLTTALLEEHGYAVSAAADADEALAAFGDRPERFDLLLTDVVLRGESGTDLARRVVSRRPELPVLFMSGYADGLLDEHGVLPPGTVLITKPFRADELIRHVHEAIQRSPRSTHTAPGGGAHA